MTPQFSEESITGVFEPGTMMWKKGLATSKEGLRKYWSTSVYKSDEMVSEEWLDHMMELSKKWNELYRTQMTKYWDKKSLKEHHERFFIDGVHPTQLVKNIKKKPLIIWARNSKKGVEPGVELFKKIPDAQFHMFDKAGHFLWLDQWKDFNRLVIWFLTKDKE